MRSPPNKLDDAREEQCATARLDPTSDWLVGTLVGPAYWPPAAAAPAIAQVLARANDEGVSAVLFQALRKDPAWAELPEALRAGLSSAAKQAIAWEIISATALREALDALAAQNIECLLLKGAALAYLLYPAPHCRPRGDTDLLLPDRDTAERAWQVLSTQGYQKHIGVQGQYVSHQFGCSKPGPNQTTLMLDIHWRLSNSNFFAQRFNFADLWAARRSIPALGPRTYALSPHHALIHALFHRAWHLGEGDPERLIWLYDMHLLCASFGAEDWAAFIHEVQRRGLEPICGAGLRKVQSVFATAVPADVDAALAAAPPRGLLNQMHLLQPGLRRKLADLMSLPNWQQRLGLIRELLFPDADYMRQRFGAQSRWQLSVAYLRRAMKGSLKRS